MTSPQNISQLKYALVDRSQLFLSAAQPVHHDLPTANGDWRRVSVSQKNPP